MDLVAAQAFAEKHPAHAGLILKNASTMNEAQLSALILGTQSEALSERVTALGAELTTLKAAHTKELSDAKTAHDTALSAATAKIADLETRLGIKQSTTPDVGNLSTSTATGEAAWRAEFAASAQLQDNFYAGVDSYVAHKRDEAAQAAKRR